MIEAEWWEFADRAAMAEQVADDVAFVIERAIEGHGDALLALPGGRTPLPVFQALAKRKVDWKKVTIIPTDDRLVAADDALSNVALLERGFAGTGARIVSLVDETLLADPAAAGRAADALLADLRWPPDLVMLGVGDDGHTASIFPGPDLQHALVGPKSRRALGVVPDPMPAEAPVARVTLPLASLAAAHTMMVVVAGDTKRAIVERAIEEGPSSTLPAGRVLAATEAAIDVYWSEV